MTPGAKVVHVDSVAAPWTWVVGFFAVVHSIRNHFSDVVCIPAGADVLAVSTTVDGPADIVSIKLIDC